MFLTGKYFIPETAAAGGKFYGPSGYVTFIDIDLD